MKIKWLLIGVLIGSLLFSSCSKFENNFIEDGIALEELITGYDLWYVDIHQKTGNLDVPFVSMAFTLSFIDGYMYANNNITDIGFTGNGLGILVGSYGTYAGVLETYHDLDGRHRFEVEQLAPNEIRIYDLSQNTTYVLIGYQKDTFDYDMLFYDNIEYFIQEYSAWERSFISATGIANPFDSEHYLQFTPENGTTFYASTAPLGRNISHLIWDLNGNYEVFDVMGIDDLKILTLDYEIGVFEEFELAVVNDRVIQLFHLNSETTYEFTGKGFIQLLRDGSPSSSTNQGKIRTRITRKKKKRSK